MVSAFQTKKRTKGVIYTCVRPLCPPFFGLTVFITLAFTAMWNIRSSIGI